MTKLSLANFNSIPRGSMALSRRPEARAFGQTLSADSTRFVTSLWEVQANGGGAPRRLTYSDKGEANPVFVPDGSLVFSSGRSDPTVKEDEAESRLWVLPAGGGEARAVLSIPGGIRAIVAARETDTIVFRAQVFPAHRTFGDADKAKKQGSRSQRDPLRHLSIRFWDHDLGPRWSRLLRIAGLASDQPSAPEDLTGDAVNSLEEAAISVSPDGNSVLTTWRRDVGKGQYAGDLVLITNRERRTISEGGYDFAQPQSSPDGRRIVAVAIDRGTPERAQRHLLWLGDTDSGSGEIIATDFAQCRRSHAGRGMGLRSSSSQIRRCIDRASDTPCRAAKFDSSPRRAPSLRRTRILRTDASTLCAARGALPRRRCELASMARSTRCPPRPFRLTCPESFHRSSRRRMTAYA
jgi:dipeptidyl aminopeptidase/acylaminoacyl peptidase